jgi:hypothetical protein
VPFHGPTILHPKIIKQVLEIIGEADEGPSAEWIGLRHRPIRSSLNGNSVLGAPRIALPLPLSEQLATGKTTSHRFGEFVLYRHL